MSTLCNLRMGAVTVNRRFSSHQHNKLFEAAVLGLAAAADPTHGFCANRCQDDLTVLVSCLRARRTNSAAVDAAVVPVIDRLLDWVDSNYATAVKNLGLQKDHRCLHYVQIRDTGKGHHKERHHSWCQRLGCEATLICGAGIYELNAGMFCACGCGRLTPRRGRLPVCLLWSTASAATACAEWNGATSHVT